MLPPLPLHTTIQWTFYLRARNTYPLIEYLSIKWIHFSLDGGGWGGDWTNSTVPRQAWTGRYSIFYLLSSSLHPLPFSFELSRAKSEVRNLSWVFYTLQMSLLRMSLDYRLILTAWNILEIDGQTLLGVGGISSSFLGEVRSKNYSHIPMFSLQQSTELFLQ